jgi:8-amino-7-oxononanoate synthase
MDGDLCPLPDLVKLANEFDCMLLVDEAHATGVMGTTGAGCVEHFNCTGTELIQVGTLSKALGSLGGYVAGSADLIDFLRNRAASWIYTTGLSPADTAAALAAIEIVKSEPAIRQQLWNNINYLKEKLPQDNLLPSESPIICLGLDSPEIALTMADKLQQAGIFAPAIRPPTVPTSRLRFSVMATHDREHLEKLVLNLSKIINH